MTELPELYSEVTAFRIRKEGIQNGPEIESVMRCQEEFRLSGNFTQEAIWIDRVWEKEGAVYLTAEDYDKQILNAKKGDKPWLLMFI